MTIARQVRRILATSVAVLLHTTAIRAAVAAETTDNGVDAPVALEEITVSARKVKENLQDVPISITAITGNDLEARGVQDLSGVARFTPNVEIDSTAAVSGSSIASTIFIRGIGQTDFTPNSDPGVGVYIDGVYLARSVGSLLDLIDVQSVEVLRGPQGTLFGKNTIGGAINVVSKEPSRDGGGYVEAQGGNFARHNLKAYLDAPISDTLLTSLSVATLNEDGYQRRILQPGEPDLGNINRVVARGRALWKPFDAFCADLIIDYSRGREQSVPQSVLVIEPNTGAPFLAAAVGAIPGTVTTLRPQYASQFSPGDLLNGRFISSDPDSTYYGGPSRSDFDIIGESLTLSYDFGTTQIKSISALRRLTSNFARDSLSSPFLVADTYDYYYDKQWSEELQLTNKLPAERGNVVAGLYYLGENGTDSNLVSTSIGNLQSGGSVNNYSLAAYAQTNLHLIDRLDATLGLRYTDEKKGFAPGYYGQNQSFVSNDNGVALGLPPVLALIIPGHYETQTSRVDYTGSLQYHLTQELMSYASYSTGFKAGGFSQRVGPGGSGIPAPSFDPETVAVVEVGLKWLGLNDKLRIDGDVFHTRYNEVQITPVFEGIGPVTRNAGDAEIIGGEIDWAFTPEQHWDFNGSLGLLNTRYTQLNPVTANDLNLDGTPILTLHSRLAKSPHTSVNVNALRRFDLPQGHTLSVSVNGSYTSQMFNDVLNSPELRRPGLVLWSSTASFQTQDGKWSLGAHGLNLSNKRYVIAGNSERYAGNIGYTQATYARPREWWLTVQRHF